MRSSRIFTPLLFQPTLPARGATAYKRFGGKPQFISTHAPRTGSDLPAPLAALGRAISTHAPRTGSDTSSSVQSTMGFNFNPRSPHGERPGRFRAACVTVISTHAPRTGSDTSGRSREPIGFHFNPRSPHGERHYSRSIATTLYQFQPTLPARGATATLYIGLNDKDISTHAPRTGSDPAKSPASTYAKDFNPRSPHGERPRIFGDLQAFAMISTHAPRTGSDQTAAVAVIDVRHFNPRSPHGERRAHFK